MGISTEDSFVVHDVERIALVFVFFIHAVRISFPEFLLALDNFWLGSLECLGHFKICSLMKFDYIFYSILHN